MSDSEISAGDRRSLARQRRRQPAQHWRVITAGKNIDYLPLRSASNLLSTLAYICSSTADLPSEIASFVSARAAESAACNSAVVRARSPAMILPIASAFSVIADATFSAMRASIHPPSGLTGHRPGAVALRCLLADPELQ